MLAPTRTNLLLLKEKVQSVRGSIGILKSRRLALIQEFLKTSQPYLKSHNEISELYNEAILNLQLSLGQSGEVVISSLAEVTGREFTMNITTKSIWGLPYKEVEAQESAVRQLNMRGYDYRFTDSTLEEGIECFEKVVDALVAKAVYDSKLYRLCIEIIHTTRRMRVLEEKVLPRLHNQIKTIASHIMEREREAYFRLKHFKQVRESQPATLNH